MFRKETVKTLIISCMVLLLVGMLAACGSNESGTNNNGKSSPSNESVNSGGEDTAKAKPLEITWMRYESAGREVISDSIAIQEFLARKNVKVNVQGVPKSGYNDKKKTLIATNTLPDVLQVDQNDIQNFADS